MLRFSVFPPNINKYQHILWHVTTTFKAFAKLKEGKKELRIYREGGFSLKIGKFGKTWTQKLYTEDYKSISEFMKEDYDIRKIIEGKHSEYYMDINQLPKWVVYYYDNGESVKLLELHSPYLNEAIEEVEIKKQYVEELIERYEKSKEYLINIEGDKQCIWDSMNEDL